MYKQQKEKTHTHDVDTHLGDKNIQTQITRRSHYVVTRRTEFKGWINLTFRQDIKQGFIYS